MTQKETDGVDTVSSEVTAGAWALLLFLDTALEGTALEGGIGFGPSSVKGDTSMTSRRTTSGRGNGEDDPGSNIADRSIIGSIWVLGRDSGIFKIIVNRGLNSGPDGER